VGLIIKKTKVSKVSKVPNVPKVPRTCYFQGSKEIKIFKKERANTFKIRKIFIKFKNGHR